METPTIEFKEEDLLNMHRYYMTSLYLEHKRTHTEIVDLLYERCKLIVTVSQVEKCIRDWRLELSPPPELQLEEPSTLSDDSWIMIPSMRSSPTPTNISYTPSDPNLMSIYTKRPLPSLPASKQNTKMDSKSRVRKRQPPTTDRLRATCHHGAGPSDSHEVETTLHSMPDGPTQIDCYIYADENHERVPLGLEVNRSQFSFARAADNKYGAARLHNPAKKAKRSGPKENTVRKKERSGSLQGVLPAKRGHEMSNES